MAPKLEAFELKYYQSNMALKRLRRDQTKRSDSTEANRFVESDYLQLRIHRNIQLNKTFSRVNSTRLVLASVFDSKHFVSIVQLS